MLILFSLIAGAVLFGAYGESPFTGAAIGLLLAWVYQLSERVRQLENAQSTTTPAEEVLYQPPQPLTPQTTVESPLPITPRAATPPASYKPPVEDTLPTFHPEGNALDKAFACAWAWLVGGNPFVRVGVVLLFLGVVFLLRYSLDQGLLPVELRLAGAASGALALLAYGWKLRQRQGAYGLILQAGGIGLLYLTVFGAFSLYHLLASLPAFALLVVIAIAAAALAVLQNSVSLAAFASVGGFLAPLLTSSGSNNYMGLFSFYAILNAGIVGIAWCKTWRGLNLLGFVFTFVIASVWGWSSYQPENFSTTEPFLLLFFLFYVAIAVLFSTRTPVNFKDKVDSTLVFGTPLLGFGMQIALVRDFEYGIAISALVLGAFYLLLSGGLWQYFRKQQQLLAETFLALGIIFTTLAIPFAVDGTMTAAAWAIEGAGILWVSIRQQQMLRRVFAVLLHFGALAALLFAIADGHVVMAEPFFNGSFIAMTLICAAMLVSSRLLSADFLGKRAFEQPIAGVLLFTGVVFLTLLFEVQIDHFNLDNHFTSLHLIYAALAGGLLLIMGRGTYWQLLPYLLLLPLLLLALAVLSLAGQTHSLLHDTGARWWVLGVGSVYGALFVYQQRGWFDAWLRFAHSTLLWLLVAPFTHEIHHQMQQVFSLDNAWYVASLPLVSIATVWLVLRGKISLLRPYHTPLLHSVVLPLAGLLSLWVMYSLHFSGDSSPLAWIPVLNPLDIVTLGIGLSLVALYRQIQPTGLAAYAPTLRFTSIAIGFIWLNMLVLRAQHHWNGLAWEFPDLLLTPSTQTLLAILWAVSGMALVWLGNRQGKRKQWTAGASLLGLVVLKLFVVDFASAGTIARIVSFLSVGVLLLFIGYLAPLPPVETAEEQDHA